MARNPRRIREALQALYAELPAMECRGLCQQSCGPIQMSAEERRIIESQHGPVEARPPTATCSMLRMGRCLAYVDRPMICRLWGVIDAMPCPWGCVPEGGRLNDADGLAFLAAAEQIGGGKVVGMDARTMRELLALPGAHEFFREYVQNGLDADARRRRSS